MCQVDIKASAEVTSSFLDPPSLASTTLLFDCRCRVTSSSGWTQTVSQRNSSFLEVVRYSVTVMRTVTNRAGVMPSGPGPPGRCPDCLGMGPSSPSIHLSHTWRWEGEGMREEALQKDSPLGALRAKFSGCYGLLMLLARGVKSAPPPNLGRHLGRPAPASQPSSSSLPHTQTQAKPFFGGVSKAHEAKPVSSDLPRLGTPISTHRPVSPKS